jgi:hypothetical protein
LEIGKAHIVRKSIFNFKVGQILTLIRYGYQAYFGEYNFVFTDMDNKNIYAVLRDSEDDDIKIYHHLEEYFEKLDSK